MATRAKFKCMSVTKRESWDKQKSPYLYESEFCAVNSGSDENKEFFAATPSGSIKLATVLEDHFEVGREYYIDFIPVEG